jgi:hypothetical protein
MNEGTPEEMKAVAYDKMARILSKCDEDGDLSRDQITRMHRIAAKLDHDVEKFWKRMAKFDHDIMTGKNRMCQMVRTIHPFVNADGTPSSQPGYTEKWNPDTKEWERE